MTREDIIRMAQEAGFREPNPHDGCMGLAYDYRDGTDTGASLERFAALVASAERSACAEVGKYALPNHSDLGLVVEAAIRARGENNG